MQSIGAVDDNAGADEPKKFQPCMAVQEAQGTNQVRTNQAESESKT